MDYSTGTDLWKYQWDLIHDPDNVLLAFLQDEEDGALNLNTTEWESGYSKSNGLATFLSPAGLPFTIPISENQSTNDVLITTTSGTTEGEIITCAPVGSLMGFYLDDKLYSAVFANEDATQFLGYKNEVYYADVNTKDLTIPYDVQVWDESENGFKSYDCSIDVSNLESNSEAYLFNDPDYLAAGRFVDDLTNTYALDDCGYFYHQYKDHILLEDDYFGPIVLNDLRVLNDLQLNPFYGIEVDQNWEAQGKYFKIVFYSGIGIVVLPMVVELAATVTTEQALQKSGEFAVGAIIDGTIQVGLDYLTDENATLETSLKSVDVEQMIRSGTENMLESGIVTAAASCLGDALLEEGFELKETITIESFTWDCAWGVISEVVADKVADKLGDKFTQLKSSIKNNPERFAKMLNDMDIPNEKVDEILEKFGVAAESISNSLDDLLKKLDDADLEDDFITDFNNFDDEVKQLFFENTELVESWKKLLKDGSSVSDILRKDTKVLEWISKQGDKIPQSAVDDLLTQIDKPIKETLEDAQGRLTFVLDRPGQSNKVVSVHTTSSGQIKTTSYSSTYNPELNPDIPVPLSNNRLTPDYSTTNYMHPDNNGLTVRIELSGNRTSDFTRSRNKLKELLELDVADVIDETGYTWHHLDDFEVVGDKAYCTMQLVESSAHQGTGVFGMQHSGSVAQWRAFFNSGY